MRVAKSAAFVSVIAAIQRYVEHVLYRAQYQVGRNGFLCEALLVFRSCCYHVCSVFLHHRAVGVHDDVGRIIPAAGKAEVEEGHRPAYHKTVVVRVVWRQISVAVIGHSLVHILRELRQRRHILSHASAVSDKYILYRTCREAKLRPCRPFVESCLALMYRCVAGTYASLIVYHAEVALQLRKHIQIVRVEVCVGLIGARVVVFGPAHRVSRPSREGCLLHGLGIHSLAYQRVFASVGNVAVVAQRL